MRRLGLVCATVAMLAILSPSQQAYAGNGVAIGLIGGLAAGTIIGSAIAAPRYYYGPVPVAVAGPVPVGPACYWTRGAPVWDGYRGVWVRPRIQVCD
jgi:hypothetical protein